MGKLPTLFYRRVGIGTYAKRALKGGTYHSSLPPACIWDVDSQDAIGR